jgi:hypothetical protein
MAGIPRHFVIIRRPAEHDSVCPDAIFIIGYVVTDSHISSYFIA